MLTTLFKDAPALEVILFFLFLGSGVKCLLSDGLKIKQILNLFVAGMFFGGLGVGLVAFFYEEVNLRDLWFLWGLMSYLGSEIRHWIDTAADNYRKTPFSVVKIWIRSFLKKVIDHLDEPNNER